MDGMSEIIQIRLKKNQAFNIFGHQTSSSVRAYVLQWLPDTCGPLSPTNSNCLECLAHERVYFRGFMQEQASSGYMATIIRIRCIVCRTIRPNTNTLFSLLFGPNRIRKEHSVQP